VSTSGSNRVSDKVEADLAVLAVRDGLFSARAAATMAPNAARAVTVIIN
jgi:hypothetical protein